MKKKIPKNVIYEYKPTSSGMLLMTDIPDYSKLTPEEKNNVIYRHTINKDDIIAYTDINYPKKK